MSQEGDKEVFGPWCVEHIPPVRCEVERRVDERMTAVAECLGKLLYARDAEMHTAGERELIEQQLESLRRAMISIRVIETVFEERRRNEN